MAIPSGVGQPPTDEIAEAASNLGRWGDWCGRRLPACAQCHAADGNGIGSYFPGIAGQHASYIKAQLQAWKAGTRANDPLGLMKAVADRLTDAEIDALAAYSADQPGAAPMSAENAPTPVVKDAPVAAGEVHPGEVPHQGAPLAGRDAGGAGVAQADDRTLFPALRGRSPTTGEQGCTRSIPPPLSSSTTCRSDRRTP